MGSSILRLICRQEAYGILRQNRGGGGRWDSRRMMSSSTTTTNNPSKISPWLMLPPTFDKKRGGMVYNFYSLADDKVLLFDKYSGGADPIESPDDDARVVGSSHGWLALMNRRNNDLFLSDPLSRRHIKLPPVDALPHPDFNLRRGRAHVSKVILSASPDDAGADCHAVMSFGPCDRLAFCRPCRSDAWTPIGMLDLKPDGDRYARVYEDFVYSSRSNLFNCLVLFNTNGFTLEDWDLRAAASSKFPTIDWVQTEQLPAVEAFSVQTMPAIEFGDRRSDEKRAEELRRRGWILKHLVYAEQRDEQLMLFRFMDGGATIGFVAAKVEKGEGGKMRLVGASLEGLAVFVGTNHSFTVAAAEFPHLKPNSIYFTDHKLYCTVRLNSYVDDGKGGGGGDIGIFDCGDATFSSCYYPCHHDTTNSLETIVPPPIWFTPTLP